MSAAPARTDISAGSWRALALSTFALTVSFWAWNLLAPLAPAYRDELKLSAFQTSLLVSVPVIVGSLGRIPLGALTDKFGGRIVFGTTVLVVIAPVLFLASASSYAMLLVGGFFLGIGGATFAVGIPFVNGWFPPARRGLALGIYGAGNVGTAISSFVSPRIASGAGRSWAFLVMVVPLALAGGLLLLAGRNATAPTSGGPTFWARFRAAVALPLCRDLALIYAVTFGGFVAFGVYLPTYLQTAYGLTTGDAAARAGGFVVCATVARPAGGWLADRVGGVVVLVPSLAVVALGAVVVAFRPDLPVATPAFLPMAFALGLGNGAIFGILGRFVPAAQVGAVTGVVGAAGGLGGFLPPLMMGIIFQATDSYAIALMLLSDVALAAAVFSAWRLPRPVRGDDSGPGPGPGRLAVT
jgi:NNP family nitrate/nitrite transporter-like MFS transporter